MTIATKNVARERNRADPPCLDEHNDYRAVKFVDSDGQCWVQFGGMDPDRFVVLGQRACARGWGAQPIGRIDPRHPDDPPGKVPWLAGLSGREGRDATVEEIAAMPDGVIRRLLGGERGVLNLGARVPTGVIGIDVDQYGPKHGTETLAEHVARFGPLPSTFLTTARPFEQGSGIRLFAVPKGWEGPGMLGDGVELIQRHHRFLAAPGSVHHTGRRYRLYHEDTGGQRLRPVLPPRRWLPLLPQSWLEGLYRQPRRRGAPATSDYVAAFAVECVREDAPRTLNKTVSDVRAAVAPTTTFPAVHRALWIAARRARAGCYPWTAAVDAIREAAIDAYAVRGGQLDEYEFGRSVASAVASALDLTEPELSEWGPPPARDVSRWGPRWSGSRWDGWR